jgi:transcriptional regulator with XRE-family HTH domain
MNLPKLLTDYRDRHGLTQSAAADRLGVNVNTLQNWEAGRNAPRGLALSALLKMISEKKPLPPKSAARPGGRRVTKTHKGTRAETRGGKKK